MSRYTAFALALLALTGCGDQADPQPLLTHPARNAKIPVEVSYPITSDEDDGGINPMTRRVDVRLNMKVTPEVLREIALEVKAKEKRQYERTFMFYYLPVEFPELVRQPWASTHFNPVLDVEILGLSGQEEDALRNMPLDYKGKRIGAWLRDDQYKTLDLIYEDDGVIKVAEIWALTARHDSDMIELPSSTGRRFKKVQGRDIYDVAQDGTLRIFNDEGTVISAARPLR